MPGETFILSIDGGGIRGIIPAIILDDLKKRLHDRGKRKPIADYFELVAGTSTGGIIAAGLTAPKDPNAKKPKPAFEPEELVELYEKHGQEIFSRSVFGRIREFFFDPRSASQERYDASTLTSLLVDKLGAGLISQARTKVMITAYDIEARRAVFMTNCSNSKGGKSDDYRFWEACRATSAAPTFFEPARVRRRVTLPGGGIKEESQTLIDGGVFANDPAMGAFTEATKQGIAADDICMMSIGTGYQNRPYTFDEAKNWGPLSWISPSRGSPIISILMQGQASSTSYQLDKLLNVKGKTRYFRFDAQLEVGKDELDDASASNILALKSVARQIIDENDAMLDEIADRL